MGGCRDSQREWGEFLMSQTWVIKDTAPVDAASRELSTQQCSFTSNGEKFSSISIYDAGAVYVLTYDDFEVAGAEVGMGSYEFDWSGNEAYKTLIFDTAPTGELLAWLQKNADEQSDPEYLTRKSELTSVANAIRAKGKTSAQLVYPDGFVTAIQAIRTGTELKIIVSVASGATVTATKGSLSVSGKSVNGTCTLIVPEAGTWSVKATLSGQTSNTKSVTFTDSYDVTLAFVSPTLNDNDWAKIRKVSDAGQGANYWSIGDRKAVTLNGTVGHLSLSNYTTYAFIIGFNHNARVEGTNRIHFQLAKTALSGGTDVCFCDSKYAPDSGWSSPGAGYFVMNASDTNSGGWKSSQMRTNICGTSLSSYSGTIIAVIPAALRAVLKSVTKYTDNTGGESTAASTVTATTDYFFLLSEFEVFGSIIYGNTNEKNKQAQYAYYSAGNSKIKYKHNGTSTAAYWWLRSPSAGTSSNFVLVYTDGTVIDMYVDCSLGFAPGFCV